MCQPTDPSHRSGPRTACGLLAIVFVIVGLLGIGLALTAAAAPPEAVIDIATTSDGAASPQVIERLPCGPAALYVTCHLLGRNPDLYELIRLTAPDETGSCSMLALKRAAEHVGLYAYGLKMTERDLASFRAVGIAQVESCSLTSHYVTVAAVRKERILIADVLQQPNVQWVSLSDFLERWTGHMLALSREPLTITKSQASR